jgi:hypothetical protein
VCQLCGGDNYPSKSFLGQIFVNRLTRFGDRNQPLQDCHGHKSCDCYRCGLDSRKHRINDWNQPLRVIYFQITNDRSWGIAGNEHGQDNTQRLQKIKQ